MMVYLLRQGSLIVVTLLLITLLAFALNFWFPGDPLLNMTGLRGLSEEQYQQLVQTRAFDGNLWQQYLNYLSHLLQGDWGIAQDGEAVAQQWQVRFPATLEIVIIAMILALLTGIPVGVVAALNYRSTLDRALVAISLTGTSIPVFWLAQILILILAVSLGLLPIAGQINPLFNIPPVTGSILIDISLSNIDDKPAAFYNAFTHMIMPVLVLAIMPAAFLARFTRSAMRDVLSKNYIISAYAKGLARAQVIRQHAFPNTMQVVTRQLGMQFSLLVTNTLITEMIFSWPGIGSWLIRSIYERDYTVIQSGLITMATLILLVNVLLNLIHAWRYPQVRQELYATH